MWQDNNTVTFLVVKIFIHVLLNQLDEKQQLQLNYTHGRNQQQLIFCGKSHAGGHQNLNDTE